MLLSYKLKMVGYWLSTTAYKALEQEQIAKLEQSVQLVPLDVSAIELAGGSVRCMLAGIHLSKR